MGILTFCDSLTGGALNHVNCQHYVMGNLTKTFQKKLNVQGFSLRGGDGHSWIWLVHNWSNPHTCSNYTKEGYFWRRLYLIACLNQQWHGCIEQETNYYYFWILAAILASCLAWLWRYRARNKLNNYLLIGPINSVHVFSDSVCLHSQSCSIQVH